MMSRGGLRRPNFLGRVRLGVAVWGRGMGESLAVKPEELEGEKGWSERWPRFVV